MYKLIVYVPTSHLSQVKAALFAVGAGKIGNYDCCCWSVSGQGQFRPMAGANPYLGQINEVKTVVETRLELVCEKHIIKAVVAALVEAHPYEEPAYQVFEVVDINSI